MGKKTGTADTADSPTAPDKAADADDATAGGMAAAKAKGHGKDPTDLGAATVPAAGAGDGEAEEEPTHYISIELVDDEDKPVPNEPYEVTSSDDEVHPGNLDDKGKARIERLPAGNCKITFPEIPGQEWTAS